MSPTSDCIPPPSLGGLGASEEDPECCHLLLGSPAKTPPHRLCLETSFGPEAIPTPSSSVAAKPFHTTCSGANHNGLASGSSSSSSYASTMAATATTATATSPPLVPHPLLSPWEYPSILEEVCQRQSPLCKSPSTNQWPPLLGSHWPTTKGIVGQGKVDLVHDDWFGLAPLATPESLSEVSSISSRASLGLVLGPRAVSESVFVTPPCRRGHVTIRTHPVCLGDSLDGEHTLIGLTGDPGSTLPMVTSSSEEQSFESAQSSSSKQVTFDLGDFGSRRKDNVVVEPASASLSSWRNAPRGTWKADHEHLVTGSLIGVSQPSTSLASPTVSSNSYASHCSSQTSVSPCLTNGPKVTKYPFKMHSVGQGESSV